MVYGPSASTAAACALLLRSRYFLCRWTEIGKDLYKQQAAMRKAKIGAENLRKAAEVIVKEVELFKAQEAKNPRFIATSGRSTLPPAVLDPLFENVWELKRVRCVSNGRIA